MIGSIFSSINFYFPPPSVILLLLPFALYHSNFYTGSLGTITRYGQQNRTTAHSSPPPSKKRKGKNSPTPHSCILLSLTTHPSHFPRTTNIRTVSQTLFPLAERSRAHQLLVTYHPFHLSATQFRKKSSVSNKLPCVRTLTLPPLAPPPTADLDPLTPRVGLL